MQRIYVPQLAVVHFKLPEFEYGKKQLEALSDFSFSFSYDEKSNDGVFYKLFPKSGGRLLLEENEYVFEPPPNSSTRPRIRLILAVPSDHFETTGNEFIYLIRRIKLVALMAQSVFALALRQRYGNDIDHHLTFSIDTMWNCNTAEVPMERRSFSGTDQLFFSDPLVEEGNEQLPPIAILRTDRTAAELYGAKNMAAYLIECLELLCERNPLQLLNLVFVLPTAKVDGVLTLNAPEKFETRRDVCVISSSILLSLPASVSDINAILACTKQLHIRTCRSLPRIISNTGTNGNYVLRHTIGGAVASLLGAIVHEIGHLFKLPHTISGIMKIGGDNIQTLFLANKLINLAFHEGGSRHCAVNLDYFYGDRCMSASDELISERICESRFDEISLDLLRYSRFIAWNPLRTIQPIVYDRESRLLRSAAGIVRVVYFTGCTGAHFISYSKYSSVRQLILDAINGARILAVASDGNFAIFAL